MHLILVMPLLVIKPSMVFDENLLFLSKTLNNYVQFLAVLYIFLILCPIFVDKYRFVTLGSKVAVEKPPS